ncbi:related to Protein sip5 [Phialocephala subalpina]|uniref:Related to Protein sip5 n=1 Tax=Phialocephala subalpina TaxID=576137 RepID=A0A1L7X7E2_9HELO|nr:related to Protein sip5 [Phialocephala subalpina]
MGNTPTKESRGPDSPLTSQRHPDSTGGASGPTSPTERSNVYTGSRAGRGSRPDLSFLGIGSSSHTSEVPERRETKQEREARKLEKERAARIKERERSLKEEHVDGGYLVTMGVYTGPEDFNKSIVRQLMIERRIAPFWRGLDDFKEEWTEHQLVAVGRGLPVPAPDEVPDELLLSPVGDSPHASNPNLQNLTVPISSRSHSTGSDASATLSPSHPAFASQPTSPAPPSPAQSSSPFRPRSKTLASLTTSSKNPSSSEIVPREIQLPRDPFVNGQAIEVFLYKDSAECPICFLFYPPYLNRTRCCDQSICSECFVQIKRPDPHPPEHHDPSNPPPAETPTAAEESLVSEPACCPYCQQPEFGVTYEPPPFRRGLAYANAAALGSFASAMSSSSSLNSAAGPSLLPNTHKRRTTSISANASTVITTDRVRPDWNTKLQAARNHLARRSAAATALHTAAYMLGNNTADTRSFRGRFGRHRQESSPGASGAATPSPTAEPGTARSVSEQLSLMRREAHENGGQRRRSRMDDLEDMMMMEAIRLSLAAEEERKKKAEKEAAKDAKKKAKEEKKREKKEKKGVYGSGASSASGSALSLLPGIGRRRGNSGASNLQREIMPEDAETSDAKGKSVDRGNSSGPSAPIDFHRSGSSSSGIPGARHLDTTTLATISDTHQSSSPTVPDRPSHLRHMSNASSPASSFVESTPGSLRNDFHTHGSSSTLDSPNASGTNLVGSTGNTDGGDANGSAGPESMFNFQSLAAMIGKDDKEDQEDAAKHIEHLGDGGQSSRHASQGEGTNHGLEESVATLKVNNTNLLMVNGDSEVGRQTTLLESQRTTPEVMVTPETPAAANHGDDDGKQLGAGWTGEVSTEITQ